MLAFCRSRVMTWQHFGPPVDPLPTDHAFVCSLTTSALASRLMHNLYLHPSVWLRPSAARRRALAPSHPDISTLPPFPLADTHDAWQLWLGACTLRQRVLRATLRRLLRPHTDPGRARRRISHLLRASPKQAHRRIFDTPDNPDICTSADLTAIWDPHTHHYVTEPAAMAALTHAHFSREWSCDPTESPHVPYPWDVPGAADPFTLETPAHTHTPFATCLVPYVLREHIF